MANVWLEAGTVTTGVAGVVQALVSAQVVAVKDGVNAWPGRPTCISYVVPGESCTRLPRHSLLRESYHMARPGFHVVSTSLNLRYWIWHPAAPGFVPGTQ